MLGFVRGTVKGIFPVGKNVSSVVLWTGQEPISLGVGYSVIVSESLASTFTTNSTVELWTYSVQGEKESYLMGLASSEKLQIFLKMLNVSGVGPKTAMLIVDTLAVDELRTALLEGSVEPFAKIPGVGRKTAAKIIVEYAGKDLNLEQIIGNQTGNDLYPEVAATLRRLGYSSLAARESITKALPTLRKNPDATVAELVKLVLMSH